MNEFDPFSPELEALLEAERQAPEPTAAEAAKVFATVTTTLRLPPYRPGGGGSTSPPASGTAGSLGRRLARWIARPLPLATSAFVFGGAVGMTREQIYERQRLTVHDRGLSRTWQRGDDELSFPQIQDLAESVSASADAYHAAQRRALGLGILAGLGGGAVGFTAGYTLTARTENQLSGTTQAALYAGGGTAIVLALVLAAVTHNSADDIEATYNAGLRRQLGLPDPKPPEPAMPAAYIEHAFRF